jgi:hypothetical protein
MSGRTVESVFTAAAGRPLGDDLLQWPPDVFAVTNIVLTQSEAFRFALSPRGPWPPERHPDWSDLVVRVGREWSALADDGAGSLPDLVVEAWATVQQHAELPIEELAQGLDRRVVEALLTLHAVADEACAGLGVALDTSDADAGVYRARGRELLARTGSIARIDPTMVRVLPKVRTAPTGRAPFSRYACLVGPGIGLRWHKVPARHRGADLSAEHARILLLPWPLRVRTSDFRPVAGPIRRQSKEPYGFFEFAPQEPLDLDLLDRVLVAARDEAGSVDVVYLPESAVDEAEIEPLEALLHRHGVIFLQTGVREHSPDASRFAGNAIHMGVNPILEKGASPAGEVGAPWFHYRQAKHHRWSLDEAQIQQYHLGGVLHPHVRWWEAMDVPRRSIEVVEVAELALACLVCEDLAQNDDAANLIRSVGPTIVFPALLDGPQLTSRWASRYASVLADDPGCAVLTLTSYGMVERSRPRGRTSSPVVALWKDSVTGVREIPLEDGAQGILLTVCMDRATRRSADGRWPVRNGTQCFDAAVHQVHAATTGSGIALSAPPTSAQHVLETTELTILTGWAEAVAEALVHAPERTGRVLAEARAEAGWRTWMPVPRPSPRLRRAIELLADMVETATSDGAASAEGVLHLDRRKGAPGHHLAGLVQHVLVAMVEERRSRHPAAPRT